MSATPPEPDTGEQAHIRNLEALYRSAPVNGQFRADRTIVDHGRSEMITDTVLHTHIPGSTVAGYRPER